LNQWKNGFFGIDAMQRQRGLWTLLFACAFLGTSVLAPADPATIAPQTQQPAAQQSSPPQQVASVEDLKTQAFRAFKGGQFDRSNELLKTAASLSPDPTTEQMSAWFGQFETQQAGFAAERHTQFDKAVADIHKLLDASKPSFAADRAREAYVLADDKDAFRREPWIDALVRTTVDAAAACEGSQEWFKAVRLYSDLGVLDPAKPVWKDKLKLATRRIRLVAEYTPDQFKAIQEAESKERDAADALINPPLNPQTTQTVSLMAPTTQSALTKGEGTSAEDKAASAATKPEATDDENDSFRIDWKDQLKGIRIDMLLDALNFARADYWRDISYKTLVDGGLKGMMAIATTPGLEKAFPDLGDSAKRQAFIDFINQSTASVDAAAKDDKDNESLMRGVLADLEKVNDDTLKLPDIVVTSEFADGAFGELDPFTSMIWPSDVPEFEKSTRGEFAGVGIQIELAEDGNLKVVSPLEDSPAYKLGIQADDEITRIDGKVAKGITLTQAVNHITGPAGTSVTLTVRSLDGAVKDYNIVREVIKVSSVKGWQHLPGGGWDYFVDPTEKIGYVRLTNFTKGTDEDMSTAISEMREKGVRAMILDLRYNPGGLLTAAVATCQKFMHSGVIVSTKAERDGAAAAQPPLEAHDSPDVADFPLVVLVNQYSASASEIVSGALHDQHRAIIVGERTFGKGSVQMLFPLANDTAFLKLTTSHYYLPSGRCIHREENSTTWGVDPDVTVAMTPKQMSDAIEAREHLDVLRSADAQAPTTAPIAAATPTTQPTKKDALTCDPQLSAALLVLRLELAGATL
jgi:carboxyl-terminal processing protease